MVVHCETLDEVRANIDRLDRQIVALIAERGKYVEQAARFKATPDAVFDEARFNQIISKVRALANDAGTSVDVVEMIGWAEGRWP